VSDGLLSFEAKRPAMGDWIFKALLIGFAAWVIWSVLRPRYVFEIRIQGGRPHVRKGKVTGAFLGRVEAV
jgi:hypothetical protein